MRKFLPLGIVIILAASGLGAAASHECVFVPSQINTPAPMGSSVIDELDQSMTNPGGFVPVGNMGVGAPAQNISFAQSFVPQKDVLTRVQFLMARNATATYPCVVAVRENLTGATLASSSVDPSLFPVYDPENPGTYAWITFNLTGVWVTPGTTYYLVLMTANVSYNYYVCAGNGSNVYPNGTALYSFDDGLTWTELVDADACFKTYGLRETFFEVTPLSNPFGFGIDVKNVGPVTAWNVEAGITITVNGLFSKTNKTFIGTLDHLDQNASFQLKTSLIIGLGRIHITVWTQALNVHKVSIEKDGLLLFFFIIIK